MRVMGGGLAADCLGCLAALLVFITFCMKRLIPLRLMAIASNVAFIGYGYTKNLYPVLVLHLVLLPLNCVRLAQLRTTIPNKSSITLTHALPVATTLSSSSALQIHNELDQGPAGDARAGAIRDPT